MHWPSIASVLLLTSSARAFWEQVPLAGSIEPITKIHKDDAPSYRSELLKLHKDLVSISSVSGAEENVGRWLVKYLAGKGYKTAYQPVPARETTPEGEDRYNIIAWYGPQEPTPKVLVTSHIDVVPPYIPYGINSEHPSKDTVITGRGSVDAKGSVAAMITALEELRSRDAASNLEDVMLVFVVGEEVAGEGMRVFSESLRQMDPPATFSAVIFGEPTENKLACGHKGGLFCDLYAKGTGGHSGYPWLGKSANELLIRALAKIVETDLGSSERFGNTTVNVGTLDGGVAANVIPENAKAGIAARVAIGPEKEGAQVVKKRMEAILKEVDEEAFRLECSGMYGFVECDCDVDGFETIVVNYGTDIPNIDGDHTRYLYGPGTILVAHGDHENLTVAQLEDSVEGYQKLILHALKNS